MAGFGFTLTTGLTYLGALVLAFLGMAGHRPMVVLAGLVVAAAASLVLMRKLSELRRAEYIRTYVFPRGLFDKLAERRPELERKDAFLVARGLRQFFLAYLASGRKYVSMPSQVADDLWHEFILYTREYQKFCRRAFGGFFHHSPAVVLSRAQREGNGGLRRVWWQACKEENIDPRRPSRLPLLFALDNKLGIANGFVYVANCRYRRANGDRAVFCGGDFSDSSFDGSTFGFGDGGSNADGGSSGLSDSSHGHGGSGDSGGDSGTGSNSCGGGSCGGGGCGGGGGGD